MTQIISVIGAGQMGAGIAQIASQAGYLVKLYDSNSESIKKGLSGIDKILTKNVEKEKISSSEKDLIMSRISGVDTLEGLKDSFMVIEAIIENFDIKASLFKNIEKIVSKDTIIASNTSSISITKLAACISNPERFVGMHFMNPVPVMKLVELIRGLQTSDPTYEATKFVAEKMDKITVLGVDSAGFIVNRILCPMINEAIYLLQEGCTPEDIDNAMKLGTNQPMGPLTLADFVGLDTLLYILRILHRELGEDKYRPCPLLIKYVDAGWYGKKTGRGFYKY
jgi:3-hydroxybutyryl-CoA dehydrogenase